MRLFAFEVRWAKAAFATIFPEGTALPHGIASLTPETGFAETIARAPLEQAVGLRLSLWLVALAPVVFFLRPCSIAGLSPERREAVLERLLESSIYPVRQLALAFKAFAALLYYAGSPVARALIAAGGPGRVPVPLESGFVTLRRKHPACVVPAPDSSGILPLEIAPSPGRHIQAPHPETEEEPATGAQASDDGGGPRAA
jgi:hypothetical protein